jgi:CBS domain-containing protein
MRVSDVMTRNVACCSAETSLLEVARMMVDHDCGEIPVVDGRGAPIGVVTDRDITCRTVAEGRNSVHLLARDCMSTPCVTVTPETSLEACCQTLEAHRIRRVPVVDAAGECCGIVSQADIARRAPRDEAAQVVKRVSERNLPAPIYRL